MSATRPTSTLLLPTCLGRSKLDGKEIPGSWHAFEFVLSPVLEFDV
jgi:hypothetical protein